MPRTKNTVQKEVVQVRIPVSMIKLIDQKAVAYDCTRSDVLKAAINAYLGENA